MWQVVGRRVKVRIELKLLDLMVARCQAENERQRVFEYYKKGQAEEGAASATGISGASY